MSSLSQHQALNGIQLSILALRYFYLTGFFPFASLSVMKKSPSNKC